VTAGDATKGSEAKDKPADEFTAGTEDEKRPPA
jgi:hypothetical protein